MLLMKMSPAVNRASPSYLTGPVTDDTAPTVDSSLICSPRELYPRPQKRHSIRETNMTGDFATYDNL